MIARLAARLKLVSQEPTRTNNQTNLAKLGVSLELRVALDAAVLAWRARQRHASAAMLSSNNQKRANNATGQLTSQKLAPFLLFLLQALQRGTERVTEDDEAAW